MIEVRFGIVGLGNIGLRHARCLSDGNVAGARLTAVCSRKPAVHYDWSPVAVFSDVEAMIRSGAVDAELTATPHPA